MLSIENKKAISRNIKVYGNGYSLSKGISDLTGYTRYYVHFGRREVYSTISMLRLVLYVNTYLSDIDFKTFGQILETLPVGDVNVEQSADYADTREYSVSTAYGDTETTTAERFDCMSDFS